MRRFFVATCFVALACVSAEARGWRRGWTSYSGSGCYQSYGYLPYSTDYYSVGAFTYSSPSAVAVQPAISNPVPIAPTLPPSQPSGPPPAPVENPPIPPKPDNR